MPHTQLPCSRSARACAHSRGRCSPSERQRQAARRSWLDKRAACPQSRSCRAHTLGRRRPRGRIHRDTRMRRCSFALPARTCDRGITNIPKRFRALNQGFPFSLLQCRQGRTRMGGAGGLYGMCMLHAGGMLWVLWLVRFGESFHAYTRFIRWTFSNSTVY